MATPIVHASLGIVAVSVPLLYYRRLAPKASFGVLVAAAFLACLPDLDLLVSLVLTGDVRTYHFGVSHSYAFSLLAGLVLAIRFRWAGFLWAAALVASHVVVDSLTGPVLGWHSSVGIRSLWPFTDEVLVSPVSLFHGVDHSDWFGATNIRVVAYDMLLFGAPALVCIYLVLSRSRVHDSSV